MDWCANFFFGECMNLTVEVMGNYVSIVGSPIAEVSVEEGASVMDLIGALAKKYGQEFTSEIYKPLTAPEAGSFHARTPMVFINHRGIDVKALRKTIVKPEDEIAIAPPIC